MTAVTVGCLFCQTGIKCKICSPQQDWPSWFKVGGCTPAYQMTNVQSGKHPLGNELNAWGYCQTCVHLKSNGRITCGLNGKDVRQYWRACEKYEDDPWK